MRQEHAARAVGELRQSGKPSSGAAPVLQHAPEACKRVAVVTTGGRHARQPTRLVPVGQRRRALCRPVEATAVGAHAHLCAGVAHKGQHLLEIWPYPLRVNMRDHLRDDA